MNDIEVFVEIRDFQNCHHISADVFELERTVTLRHVFLGVENGSNSGRIQIRVSRKIKDDIDKTFAVFFNDKFFESECVFKADTPLNSNRASCAFCENFCIKAFHVCITQDLL